MKGAGPHLQIIGLMDNAALVGPVVMQRENEILEGHEQSSRGCGGQNFRARRYEMTAENNRNIQRLSMHNPSRIKELQHVFSTVWMDVAGLSPVKYSAHIFQIDP